MILKYDEPLSNFAFNFNVRRYIEEGHVPDVAPALDKGGCMDGNQSSLAQLTVGRCRLTVSKPVLKAPMVSALETKI